MLPIIDLDVASICEAGFSFFTSRPQPIGKLFRYDWQAVQDAAEREGLNLDRFLTLRLVSFYAAKRLKPSILIWFAPFPQGFCLTVSCRSNVNLFEALHSSGGMPGFLEYGSDFVPQNAAPMFYATGGLLYRTYEVIDPEEDELYICDFGNLFGMDIQQADVGTYQAIQKNPRAHFDYSSVPLHPSEEFRFERSSFILHHAYCRLRR